MLAETLLIFDSLNPLAITSISKLPSFLSSLLSPTTSILATYHTDIPIPQTAAASPGDSNPYSPDALTTLKYLATAVLRISSLSQAIEKKKARDRSLEEPVFGLEEGKDGILMGLQKRVEEGLDGVVLGMEIRRKSGRGVREMYVLFTGIAGSTSTSNVGPAKAGTGAKICLLDDHPLYAPPTTTDLEGNDDRDGEGEVETTFNLGLTEKQRRDREGVVLPYFDAQRGEGAGEGGRILYEMDRGDDFDEEEDEI
jgi:elongator complex protein 5